MILATFFEISPEDILDILGYAGDLVADFMPLLVVLVGIIIGIWVVRVILQR